MMRRFSYLFMFFVALMLCGCVTTGETESYVERHRMETLIDRMDSVMTSRTIVSQDSSWRQEILRQFQSIKEKSDTSHILVTDTAGKVIKEKIVINNVREVTNETDRQEIQMLSHRIEIMDSTMSLMREQIQHSDSLLQQYQKETVRTVETPMTWWHDVQIWFGRLAMIAIAILAALWILRRRLPWLPFGK